VLGGAKGNMIGSMIASQFSQAQNWPLGSAMAVLMIAAVLVALVAGALVVWVIPWITRAMEPISQRVRRSIHERNRAVERSTVPARVSRFESIKVLFAAWSVLVLAFMFIPILLVFRHSFNVFRDLGRSDEHEMVGRTLRWR
jgi:hypothetical protein